MPRKQVADPLSLLGKLWQKPNLMKLYGFEIIDIKLHQSNEEIEDMALRCIKHNLLLEKNEALVLRKHRDTFIHHVLKPGLGKSGDCLNVIFEVIEYNASGNGKLLVYIRTPCNHLDQRIPNMHAVDVAWGKEEVENGVNFFWGHRGASHQYRINNDNTISYGKAGNLVFGCNLKGELVLVNKSDMQRRLVFKSLHETLITEIEKRLKNFRIPGMTALKKQGLMKDWKEPGTNERKMPGRLASFELMGRAIHEVIAFGDGNKVLAGDPYFASRIDRWSRHEVELISREESGVPGGEQYIDLSFRCDLFDKCVIRLDINSKHVQYIASQFHEVNLDIVWPSNLMCDVSNEKDQNTHFIHHVLFVEFTHDADVAKDDPSLPVLFEEIVLENKDVQYIQQFNRKHNTNFIERGYFIKWIGKHGHSLDVRDGKIQDNQDVLFFWQHRGRNQQFCVEQNQQTIHPLGKFELAFGCRNDGLKLVPRESEDMLRFANFSNSLKFKNNNMRAERKNEIAIMSRADNEWESPVVIAYGALSAITDAALT